MQEASKELDLLKITIDSIDNDIQSLLMFI